MREPGLPGDGALGLDQRFALHAIDELLQLRLADRLIRPLPLLAVRRREPLDELTGDADDDLARPKSRHLLRFLERDGAVIDDRRDVRDGPRLHVRETLALAPDPADGAEPFVVDLEDQCLGELRPDVERGAGGQSLGPLALPDPAPERHQPPAPSRPAIDSRTALSASANPSRLVPIPCAICGRPPPFAPIGSAATLTRSPADSPRSIRSSDTVTQICGASASRNIAMTPLPSSARTSFDAALSASIDSYGSVAITAWAPGATSSARAASSAGFGTPAPPSRARRFASRRSCCSDPIRSGTRSTDWAPTSSATWSSVSRRARMYSSAPAPVSASMRRCPEPMLRSPVITKLPIWPVARQCVPPHSSKL